ncbi:MULTISPECIES: serine--tRNA ligase [Halocynthiibacter]|uniref:Serine--tRNA ligase n=1 Tax=Halocynthiibacter halioticoli TaxID=2986804 RepID=A0AAE3J0S6_9RHOB|nr:MULTISPECIES: serine--tRNA ligase [Halocynthiibacter]MCV6824041.1 serine--tRNA ligase [Halocynthiibacter halioticoli]MCW4057042.1 serine--tRNA ligase [Halocynthiibacter sp. SDUM655004]
MHDIRQIRENPAAFDAAMARRGLSSLSEEILALDAARREKIAAAEDALATRNKASKEVGAAKARGDEEEFERLRALVAEKKAEIATLEEEAKAEDAKLRDLLMGLPNAPADDIPDGADEDDNVEIRRWGTPREFSFKPKEHYEIKAVQDGMDFETAAKLSGSRFVVLSGAVARLHRALGQFMIDTHIDQHGLTETNTPVLVRTEMMEGTGQLPKFGEDSYQTTNGWWLIPTAEVTLTNIVNNTTISESYLPRRYVAQTQCFRSEAGSAGRDTAGMLRQHQFEKVEMVSITRPEDSEAEHKRMTECAQNILEALGLPYRTVVLCTGDLGFGMKRTHDMEVWLPGQDQYREVSSVSLAGDFQARRMNARYKPAEGGKPEFVHTLNGSGLAIGRTLIAVLENGQEEDGSVTLPACLHAYLGGKTRITAEGELV